MDPKALVMAVLVKLDMASGLLFPGCEYKTGFTEYILARFAAFGNDGEGTKKHFLHDLGGFSRKK